VDVNIDPLLLRGVVPEGDEPCRAAGAPPGRVDDEVGVDDLLGCAVVARQETCAGHPRPGGVGHEAAGVAPLDDVDVRQRQDAPAHGGLDQRSRRRGHPLRQGDGDECATVEVQPQASGVADDVRAVGDEVVGERRPQRLERQQPGRQQRMAVASLRHPAPRGRRGRQDVAFDDRDLLEPGGQPRRRGQPRHAPAQHHRTRPHRGASRCSGRGAA
jgi:hypothetical protein